MSAVDDTSASLEDLVRLADQGARDTLAHLEKLLHDMPNDADGVEEAHAAMAHAKAQIRLATKTSETVFGTWGTATRVDSTQAAARAATRTQADWANVASACVATRAAWKNVASALESTRTSIANAWHASTVL